MNYYEEQKTRLKKNLHKKLKEAIKEDNSFNGMRNALIEFVTGEVLGSVGHGTTGKIEGTYKELLDKLDDKGIELLEQYIEATSELEEIITIQYIEEVADFMLEHLDIIVEEMNIVTENIK